MGLLIITLAAIFLVGLALGAFALIVVGIHLDERRLTRTGTADSRIGAGPRELLAKGLPCDKARR
jgi:hypothetical protein